MTAALVAHLEQDAGDYQTEAWLLGQPNLQKLLDYIEDTALGGDRVKPNLIVDQWREANDRYYELEEAEPGLPDQIEIRDLDPGMKALAEEVERHSIFRRGYNLVPTRFAMVELDKLVVSQTHVNLTHAAAVKARVGASPSSEELFKTCVSIDGPSAPIKVRQTGSKRYSLWSDSSDIRFHEAALLQPDQLNDYAPLGKLGAVLGLFVGFGSNFLNAVQSDNRLVLHNGHHRAYGLRAAGITHAPCIIQTVTRREELNIVGSREVCNNPAFYFKAERPPLLKDFFDPKLRIVLKIPKLVRMLEISFDVRDFEAKDFAAAG